MGLAADRDRQVAGDIGTSAAERRGVVGCCSDIVYRNGRSDRIDDKAVTGRGCRFAAAVLAGYRNGVASVRQNRRPGVTPASAAARCDGMGLAADRDRQVAGDIGAAAAECWGVVTGCTSIINRNSRSDLLHDPVKSVFHRTIVCIGLNGYTIWTTCCSSRTDHSTDNTCAIYIQSCWKCTCCDREG